MAETDFCNPSLSFREVVDQLRTGAMVKLATPTSAASSTAKSVSDTDRERSSATAPNRQTGRLLSAKVMVNL